MRFTMPLTTAKVFMNGRSQAIRLPKEFRVNTNEVYITRADDRIIILPKPERFSSKKFELNRDNDPPQFRELF
jgi:antitoxin VapB